MEPARSQKRERMLQRWGKLPKGTAVSVTDLGPVFGLLIPTQCFLYLFHGSLVSSGHLWATNGEGFLLKINNKLIKQMNFLIKECILSPIFISPWEIQIF